MPTNSSSSPSVLIDRFGRVIDYVRISVTDRCDFRCVYCMAEHMEFLPRPKILTLEEIHELCLVFVGLGVKKIRITGGEPLVRNGIVSLLKQIGALRGLRDFVMTTNGARLGEFAEDLKQAGINRINLSLDSLKPDRFRLLTRVGNLETVLHGLDVARGLGFQRIKLNSVVLRNRNHDEVVDLVNFAIHKEIDISFIEEMPLGIVQGHDRREDFYSSDEVREDIEQHFDLLPSTEMTGGPARYYRIAGTGTKVGFISPHSHNFCGTCNRVRVTAEGRLLLCLGNEHSIDLRAILRSENYTREKLELAIVAATQIKPERHHFDIHEKPVILRHMSVTGG